MKKLKKKKSNNFTCSPIEGCEKKRYLKETIALMMPFVVFRSHPLFWSRLQCYFRGEHYYSLDINTALL